MAAGARLLRDARAWRSAAAAEILRIIECQQGAASVEIGIAPRFDYGSVRPWLRRSGSGLFSAIGGDDGLLIWSDEELDSDGESLCARASLHTGERLRVLMRFVRPHLLEDEETSDLDGESVDARLAETIAWWQRWRERLHRDGVDQEAVVLAPALTLKALTYAPTGAIVAAPTASLPETLGVSATGITASAGSETRRSRRTRWPRWVVAGRLSGSAGAFHRAQLRRARGGFADPVRDRRGATHPRAGARPGGLPRLPPCAGRQRGGSPVELDALGEILNLAWRWHRRGSSR